MCSGNRRRNSNLSGPAQGLKDLSAASGAMGHTQSYLAEEQERLGDTPRMRDQIPADAPLGAQFAANFVDMSRPPVPKKTIDYSKPRTIKPGTTVSGRQKNQTTATVRQPRRTTRVDRRSGTNSLRIPRNTNTGSGNLNY